MQTHIVSPKNTTDLYKRLNAVKNALECAAVVQVTRKGNTGTIMFRVDGRHIIATIDNKAIRYNKSYTYAIVIVA